MHHVDVANVGALCTNGFNETWGGEKRFFIRLALKKVPNWISHKVMQNLWFYLLQRHPKLSSLCVKLLLGAHLVGRDNYASILRKKDYFSKTIIVSGKHLKWSDEVCAVLLGLSLGPQ